MRARFVAGAVLLVSGLATAQEEFHVQLDGAQEVPAVVSDAHGFGRVRLLDANGRFDWKLYSIGLDAVGASIWIGDPGSNGTRLADLDGGGPEWSGNSANLTPAVIAELRAGRCYVRMASNAHPQGEIRGHLLASPHSFATWLSSRQLVPPHRSSATGSGRFSMQADLKLRYSLDVQNFVGTTASVEIGPPGQVGTHLFDLRGDGARYAGATRPLTPDEFSLLQSGNLHVVVRSSQFPDGEVRGQIVVESIAYGVPTGTYRGSARLSSSGAPTPGSELQIDVVGGRPHGLGTLWIATDVGASRIGDVDLLVGGQAVLVPVVLDAQGRMHASEVLPPLAVDDSFFLQFFGSDPNQKNRRLYASNALEITIAQM